MNVFTLISSAVQMWRITEVKTFKESQKILINYYINYSDAEKQASDVYSCFIFPVWCGVSVFIFCVKICLHKL